MRHLAATFCGKQWKMCYVCSCLFEWRTRVLWYIRKDISLKYAVPTFRVTLSKIVVLLYQNTNRNFLEDNRPIPNRSRLQHLKFHIVRLDITD